MGKMLSIYFSSDRTYLSVVEPIDKGLELLYINATEHPIDLEVPDDPDTMTAINELKEILAEIGDDISRVSVTLPADSVLVTKIPSKKGISPDEVKKLVELEIRQAYPQFNYRDFLPTVLHLAPKLDGKEIMLASIIPKQHFTTCKSVLQDINKKIANIEISQMNAHAAFLYNYPEHFNETVALIGVGQHFLDISIVTKGIPVYYNLAKIKDKEMIGDICLEEFENITANYVNKIESVYLFGEGLDIDTLVIAQSIIMMSVPTVKKLNAFRMFTSKIDKRHRDYCSRMAHIFPACIGGNLPSYHKRTDLF